MNDNSKIVMVVPTYWSRERSVGWKEGDAVYDHATALDDQNTLEKLIKSISILRDQNFELIVIACSTAEDIIPAVEKKVQSVIEDAKPTVPTYLFSHTHLSNIANDLRSQTSPHCVDLLSLRGYSSIRNQCLVTAQLARADIAVLIDDDEIFEDPDFILKIRQGFQTLNPDNTPMKAIAGYYVEVDGEKRPYYRNRPIDPWMTHWNKIEAQNNAFHAIIGTKSPRYKRTPFAFGGNMSMRKDVFSIIPFDPNVTRGEDMDYVMNAMMFGVDFYLDNELAITHCPPPRTHPMWRRVREDALRYVYQRQKIDQQQALPGMRKMSSSDLDPYPGLFLKEDLEERIFKSQSMLAADYLANNDPISAKETLRTILLSEQVKKQGATAFTTLVEIQKQWVELMAALGTMNGSKYFTKIT